MPCNTPFTVRDKLGDLVRLADQKKPPRITDDEESEALRSAMRKALAAATVHCAAGECDPPKKSPGMIEHHECVPSPDLTFTEASSRTVLVQEGATFYVQASYTQRYVCNCRTYYTLEVEWEPTFPPYPDPPPPPPPPGPGAKKVPGKKVPRKRR